MNAEWILPFGLKPLVYSAKGVLSGGERALTSRLTDKNVPPIFFWGRLIIALLF